MRWMLDYEAAVEVGMGITVTGDDLPRGESLAGGLERLVVVGVDWTLSPEAATAWASSSTVTRSATGVRPQGTPTNNTGAERSGASSTLGAG